MVRAGVSADNVDRTITSIDSELSEVGERVHAKEIAESRHYMIGAIRVSSKPTPASRGSC